MIHWLPLSLFMKNVLANETLMTNETKFQLIMCTVCVLFGAIYSTCATLKKDKNYTSLMTGAGRRKHFFFIILRRQKNWSFFLALHF